MRRWLPSLSYDLPGPAPWLIPVCSMLDSYMCVSRASWDVA